MARLLLGVEVGTTKVQAGLFDENGSLLVMAEQPLELLRPADDHAVYRMNRIWGLLGAVIRDCLSPFPGVAGLIGGLGFGASAALVLGHDGAAPLGGGADVFAAFDRRAVAEAREIGAANDAWLDHVGGLMSPEQHLPKLLWLKRQAPAIWERVTAARDLCDELARRATGVSAHSLAALATNWPYLPRDPAEPGWRQTLLEDLDLLDVWTLGTLSDPPRGLGEMHGRLSPETAATLGLPAGIPVAVGATDTQTGWLGAIGRGVLGHAERTLVVLGGATTGLVTVTREPRMLTGFAGPFADALLPDFWLHVAGQSCSGAALDALLEFHPGGPRIVTPDIHADTAAEILELLASEGPGFAARRHLVPDWLGSRAMLGDPDRRALVTGLGDELSYRAFLEAYYATARALALQLRQVVAQLKRQGQPITRVALAGGQARNKLLVRLYRDALGADLVLSETAEPGLLGAAMLAAVAAGVHPDLSIAIERMAPSQLPYAADPAWRRAHEAAYRIYLKLFDIRNAIAEESKRLEQLENG